MMLDNYPPDVSGTEDEIHGPRVRREVTIYCPKCKLHTPGTESIWRFGRAEYECYECGFWWDVWPDEDPTDELLSHEFDPDEEAPF